MKRIFILILFLSIGSTLLSQTDKNFWFVAPKMTKDHNPGGYDNIFFNITTKELPADITIEMPDNPAFTPINLTIPANATQKVDLSAQIDEVCKYYGSYEGVIGKNNNAIHVTSSSLITIYYENSNHNNCDIFALKGKNALGTEFYTSFQRTFYNQNNNWSEQAYSAFTVVGTADNTQVTIETPYPIYGHETEPSFTINLDKGEVYEAVPAKITEPPNGWKGSDVFGRHGEDHLSGARVTTNGKKVAITLSDDSMKSFVGGCYDLAGDQTIPTDVIGTEYIAMLGQLDMGEPRAEYQSDGMSVNDTIQERLYIVGTQDNDSVFINGSFYQTLDENETVVYSMNPANPFAHVRTKHPSYVWQITGFGCELGGAILPPTSACTGSVEVGFTRSTNQGYFLNIMVRNGAEDGFEMVSDGVDLNLFNAGDFQPVPGDSNWLATRVGPIDVADIPVGKQTFLRNNKDVFHIGVINGSTSGGTRFGYFSDFNEFRINSFNTSFGTDTYIGCKGDSVQLVLVNGAIDIWWSPPDYLDDPYSTTPVATPPGTIQYVAHVKGNCGVEDSTGVSIELFDNVDAQFTIDETVACAPKDLKIREYNSGVEDRKWKFGYGGPWENWSYSAPSTYDTTFNRTYNNTTDTSKRYEISLVVFNDQEMCPDTLTRYLTVYPEINAALNVSDTIGCHPFEVSLMDSSYGDTNRIEWWFGDGAGNTDDTVSHVYKNFGRSDTNFIASLEAVSPFLCRDTVYQNITVHPYIGVSFEIEEVNGCSPFTIQLNNASSSVDTFLLKYGNGDSVWLSESWDSIAYTYTTSDTLPVDFQLALIGYNEEGCSDTMSRNIRVYPQMEARFTSSDSVYKVCDSGSIDFVNYSLGYNNKYKWDFDDGATSFKTDPSHVFRNKSDSARVFDVNLMVESYDFCTDSLSREVIVYPFIKADYAIDTSAGCTPFRANVDNKSIGVDDYLWDFGDNTNDTTSDSTLFHYYVNQSYQQDSSFVFKLYVENRFGCADSASSLIDVYHNIVAGFDVDTNIACSPATFSFDATNGTFGAASWFWNFGDGATSVSEDSVKHAYAKNNTDTSKLYTVSLFVTSENNTCYDVVDTTLLEHPYVEARFAAETFIDCPPFVNTFDNSSKGNGDEFSWYINGNLDTVITNKWGISRRFDNPDSNSHNLDYIIGLNVENPQGCESYFEDTISVYPKVRAGFYSDDGYAGCHQYTVNFKDTSVNATDHYWTFGDKSTSSLSDPKHTFKNYSNEDTVYRVFQHVESYHCEDYTFKDITVYPVPNPKFELDTNSGCSPMSIGVANNTTDPFGTYQYLWTFGDGDSSSLKTPPSHYFRNTSDSLQVYKIKLRIDNANCFDTLVRDVLAFPEVNADFSMNDSAGCHSHRVIFTNQSVNSSIYKWTFGDGFQSSLKHPFHDYTNLGASDMSFEVNLHAESQWECFDDTSQFVTVYPQPVAEFTIDSIFRYYPDTVFNLTNETVHQSVWDYDWAFGDGESAQTSDPYFSHTYATWDTFDIQLKAYSDQCRDSVINSVVLFPPRPIAGFTFSKDTGCVPAVITFKDTSLYATSRKWNFDDGNTAVDEIYEHSFDQAGIYRVLLTVYGDGGKATASHVVEVFPRPDIRFVIDPADTVMLPDAQIRGINLSSKDVVRFRWEFGDGRTSAKEDPLHQYGPPPDTSYQIILTGFTQYNCSAADSLLQPIFVQGQGDIDYPNIFIPSLSGPTGGYYEHLGPENNSVFRPVTKGVIEYNLKIFNRWGELVFESNKIEKGWDGYYKDQLARQGVYIYRAEGVFSNGKPFTEVGDVTLLYHKKK